MEDEEYGVAAKLRDSINEALHDGKVAVEYANDKFYRAFAALDATAMDKVWGDGDHVQCTHPSTPTLTGARLVHDTQLSKVACRNAALFDKLCRGAAIDAADFKCALQWSCASSHIVHQQVVSRAAMARTWSRCAGRRSVMDSWRIILSQMESIDITVERVHTRVHNEVAFVTCEEHVDAGERVGIVAATNVFEKQDGQWRIVHHHGSHVPRQATVDI